MVYVPIMQESSRLVVEHLLVGLTGVSLEFPVLVKLDNVGMALRAVDATRCTLLNSSAAASLSPNNTSWDSRVLSLLTRPPSLLVCNAGHEGAEDLSIDLLRLI